MTQQLTLDGDSLVGRTWSHPEHGQCTVLSISAPSWVPSTMPTELARIQVSGPREFQMLWPVNLVRRASQTLPLTPDTWERLPGVEGQRGFHFCSTEARRLADLGLVPYPEGGATVPAAQSRFVAQPGDVVQVPAKPVKVDWRSLSKAKKRDYLLAHPTISDKLWTDVPREKGETREQYIRRVLA